MERWAAHFHVRMVFAPDPFGFPESKTLFVARDSGGALIGFLTASPMPARDASYLEDVQRVANAPRGTTDLLVVSAMEHLKQQGVRCTTLGLFRFSEWIGRMPFTGAAMMSRGG